MSFKTVPVGFTFDGTDPVTILDFPGPDDAVARTLISLTATSDLSAPDDRVVTVRKRVGGTVTTEWKRRLPAGESLDMEGPLIGISAANEEIEVLLDGSGTFKGDIVVIDEVEDA